MASFAQKILAEKAFNMFFVSFADPETGGEKYAYMMVPVRGIEPFEEALERTQRGDQIDLTEYGAVIYAADGQPPEGEVETLNACFSDPEELKQIFAEHGIPWPEEDEDAS